MAAALDGCKQHRELIERKVVDADGTTHYRLLPGQLRVKPCTFDIALPAADSPLWRWALDDQPADLLIEAEPSAAGEPRFEARRVRGAVVSGLTIPAAGANGGLLRLVVHGSEVESLSPAAGAVSPMVTVETSRLFVAGELVSDVAGSLVLEREITEFKQVQPDGTVVLVPVPGRYLVKPATARTAVGSSAAAAVRGWMSAAQSRGVELRVAGSDGASLTVRLPECQIDQELDAYPRQSDGRLVWRYQCVSSGMQLG